MRYAAALVLGLFIIGVTPAADSKKIILRWHGQSFFELESSKGTKVVFDPHAIEVYARPVVAPDLVLISHFHDDHTQIGVLDNARKPKIVWGLTAAGKKVDWNSVDDKFKDIRYRTVASYHDTMQGMERGKNTIFCLEVDGMNVVFLGDLGHVLTEGQIKAIGKVDVLLIPVGGIYTLNGAEAKKVAEQLKPAKYVVPMHFGTKVFDEVLPVDEFIEEQKNVKKYSGNKLDIESDYKPDTPQIAVL